MQGLKFLVIVMGVAIVGGVVVLAAVIFDRLSGDGETGAIAQSPGAFGDILIDAGPDARLLAAHAEGDRLIVILDEEAGRRVVVLDLRNGERLGSVGLAPER